MSGLLMAACFGVAAFAFDHAWTLHTSGAGSSPVTDSAGTGRGGARRGSLPAAPHTDWSHPVFSHEVQP